LSRSDDSVPVAVQQRTETPAALVGPAGQSLAFLLGGAPEEAGPFEIAAGERDLREARERVERPQSVLLRALHLERHEPFALRLVEISLPQGEHQELVPLTRLPPCPAGRTRRLCAPSR